MVKQLNLELLGKNTMDSQQQSDILTLPSGKSMPNGEIIIYRNFFKELESNQLFEELLSGINWRQDQIKMFGKKFDLPRLTAWYGDEGKSYKYSGITMNPDPWIPILLSIKKRIEKVVELHFNSVLLNLYRHGQDHMSWHSDDEPELGKNPVIASVSFGDTRRFLLKHKYDKDLEKFEFSLNNGSLLIMQGSTQHFWQHRIAKTAKKINPRINLTFRVIKKVRK